MRSVDAAILCENKRRDWQIGFGAFKMLNRNDVWVFPSQNWCNAKKRFQQRFFGRNAAGFDMDRSIAHSFRSPIQIDINCYHNGARERTGQDFGNTLGTGRSRHRRPDIRTWICFNLFRLKIRLARIDSLPTD